MKRHLGGMVYAADSKSAAARLKGSSPLDATNFNKQQINKMKVKEYLRVEELNKLPTFLQNYIKRDRLGNRKWFRIFVDLDKECSDELTVWNKKTNELMKIESTVGGIIDESTWNEVKEMECDEDNQAPFWIDKTVILSDSHFSPNSKFVVSAACAGLKSKIDVRANLTKLDVKEFADVFVTADRLSDIYNEVAIPAKDGFHAYVTLNTMEFGEDSSFESYVNSLTMTNAILDNESKVTIIDTIETMDDHGGKDSEKSAIIETLKSKKVLCQPHVVIKKSRFHGSVTVESSPMIFDDFSVFKNKEINVLRIAYCDIIGPYHTFDDRIVRSYRISKSTWINKLDEDEDLKNFACMEVLESIVGVMNSERANTAEIRNSNVVQSVLIDTSVKNTIFDDHEVIHCFLDNKNVIYFDGVNSRHDNDQEDIVNQLQAIDGTTDDREFSESGTHYVDEDEDFANIIDSKELIKNCKPLLEVVNKYIDGKLDQGTLAQSLFDKILYEREVVEELIKNIKVKLVVNYMNLPKDQKIDDCRYCVCSDSNEIFCSDSNEITNIKNNRVENYMNLPEEEKEEEEKVIDDCHCLDCGDLNDVDEEPAHCQCCHWNRLAKELVRSPSDTEDTCKEECKEDTCKEEDHWLNDYEFDDEEYMNSPYILWSEGTLASVNHSIEDNGVNVHNENYKKTKDRFMDYWKFKKEHGFDPSECWNLYRHLAQFLYPRLVLFKKENILLHPFGETEEESNKNLDKMIFAMRVLALGDGEDEKLFWTRIQEGCELIGKWFLQLQW